MSCTPSLCDMAHSHLKKVMFRGTTLQNRTSRSDNIINIPYARLIISISTILLMFFRDVTSLAREFEVESTFVTSLLSTLYTQSDKKNNHPSHQYIRIRIYLLYQQFSCQIIRATYWALPRAQEQHFWSGDYTCPCGFSLGHCSPSLLR